MSEELKELQYMLSSLNGSINAIIGKLNAIITETEELEYLDTLNEDQRFVLVEMKAAMREGIDKELEKKGGGDGR